jgi:diguanylate cyclase (GGDEF)-like protein
MLDIDHFKGFNDEHGHEAGDAVLRLVGETIRQSVRPGDLAFRYGGEEFLLLLGGVDAGQAESRADDLKSRIAELRPLHDGRPLGNITISAGVATSPTHGAAQRLVSMADAALLAAKKAGRNRVVSAPPSEPSNALTG